jgi:hypothetical protein
MKVRKPGTHPQTRATIDALFSEMSIENPRMRVVGGARQRFSPRSSLLAHATFFGGPMYCFAVTNPPYQTLISVRGGSVPP